MMLQFLCSKNIVFLTTGSRDDKKGSRADKGRGDCQKRATADSGDETES